MNKKLQHLVAKQYEAAGFKKISAKISGADDMSDLRTVALNIIHRLMLADPSGFGKDMHDLCKGDNSNEK